jgi:ubiquinone/menaquinone biosynthesis C-methylase UbiE
VIQTLKNIFNIKPLISEKGAAEAYDIWAGNYDAQPGNLMLDLDEMIFPELLSGISITGKRVADIGCGTGRHWAKILKQEPLSLTGFDVSEGMLNRLKQKFPQADTQHISDDLFSDVKDATFDVAVSTLTVAHIQNIEQALQAWSRILKSNADLIITDFHPAALDIGGKRTFEHQKRQIAVENFVHPILMIESILSKHGFRLIKRVERVVDESVKHYYVAKNAMHVYDKFEHCPIIYGLQLRRG